MATAGLRGALSPTHAAVRDLPVKAAHAARNVWLQRACRPW